MPETTIKNHHHANTAPSTVHTPLTQTQFRLARLHGETIRQFVPALNKDKDLISVSLEVVEFDPAPTYTAISYCWNSTQEDDRPILCDGQLLSVSKNLYDALKQFLKDLQAQERNKASIVGQQLQGTESTGGSSARKDDYQAPDVFWIDAICINQSDTAEKSVQVARMASIYARATSMIAWFGRDPSTRNQVGSMFRWIREHSTAATSEEGDAAATVPALTLEDEMAISEGFSYLIFTNWFYRAWTFQEIVLGANPIAQCGPHRAKWRAFSRGARDMMNKGYGSYMGFSGGANVAIVATELDTISKLRSKVAKIKTAQRDEQESDDIDRKGGIETLFPLLWCTLPRASSDPRDRIFSLLGLHEPRANSSLQLTSDYTLHAGEVFTRAAKVVIHETQTLDLLQYAGLTSLILFPTGRATEELSGEEAVVESLLALASAPEAAPSWVPRWHNRRHPALHNNVWSTEAEQEARTGHVNAGNLGTGVRMSPLEHVRRVAAEPRIDGTQLHRSYRFHTSFTSVPAAIHGSDTSASSTTELLGVTGLLLGRVVVRRASRFQGVDVFADARLPPCVTALLDFQPELTEVLTGTADFSRALPPRRAAAVVIRALAQHDAGGRCSCFAIPGNRRRAWLFAPFGAKCPVVLWPHEDSEGEEDLGDDENLAGDLGGLSLDENKAGDGAAPPGNRTFTLLGQCLNYSWLATAIDGKRAGLAARLQSSRIGTWDRLWRTLSDQNGLAKEGFVADPEREQLGAPCVPVEVWIR